MSVSPAERVLRVDLATVCPSGKVRRFDKRDLVSERHLGGVKVYKLVYPDVRRGTVVEERTEVMVPHQLRHLGSIRRQRFALQRTVPVLHLQLDYYLPRYWSFTFKPSTKAVRQRIQRSFPGRNLVRYHYQARQVPPLMPERYAPPPLRDLASVEFEIQRFTIDGKRHGFRPTWKHLAAFAAIFLLHEGEGFRRAALRAAQPLYHQRSTEAERLRAVIRYVQENIHVAPDGISASSLHEVLQGGYGNPAQITAVAYHMLRAAGLSTELLLVHDGDAAPFDRGFISLHEIDQPALWVNVGGVGKVVIPWLRRWPVGHAPPHLQGQWALRVGKKGYAGWMRIPKPSGRITTRKANYQVEVRDQDLRVTLVETFRGVKANRLRIALLALDPPSRKRLLRSALRRHGQRLEVHGIKIQGLDDERRPLTITSRFTRHGAVFHAGKRAVVRLDIGRVKTLGSGGGQHRRRPCQIRNPRRDVELITLKYPTGWRPVGAPAPHSLRSVFGLATREVRQGRNRLWLRQILQLDRTRQPASRAPELDRLLRTADDYSHIALAFQRDGAGDSMPRVEPPPRASPPSHRAPPRRRRVAEPPSRRRRVAEPPSRRRRVAEPPTRRRPPRHRRVAPRPWRLPPPPR
jgi:hypothetical protein